MAEELINRDAQIMTPEEYRFVIWWVAGLLIMYTLIGYFGARQLRNYAAETAITRNTWFKAPTVERNTSTADQQTDAGKKPVDVLVGLNMNRVGDFDMKESAWTADFDLSFRWTGNAPDLVDNFRIVNGQILQREKGISSEHNRERREEYKVVARISRRFDASRFPFSDHLLVVQVEDAMHGPDALRYVADKRNSGLDLEASERPVKIVRTTAGVKERRSGPEQGDPGVPGNNANAHSQFYFAMLAVPDGFGLYTKMFQALFASVAVALIALYIKAISIDCRFGLPVGGFFASVTNNVTVAALLPHEDRATLTTMVNSVCLLTIFLVLVQSVISLYIFDNMGRQRLSLLFDRASFFMFLIGYSAVNVVLPLAARPL
jgi:hypothetical protein